MEMEPHDSEAEKPPGAAGNENRSAPLGVLNSSRANSCGSADPRTREPPKLLCSYPTAIRCLLSPPSSSQMNRPREAHRGRTCTARPMPLRNTQSWPLNLWPPPATAISGDCGHNRSLTPRGQQHGWRVRPDGSGHLSWLLRRLLLAAMVLNWLLARPGDGALAVEASGGRHVIHVKVGALLEESAHEQANIFIRTIKMINERKDETIRQLLNITAPAGEQQQQHHLRRQRHSLAANRRPASLADPDQQFASPEPGPNFTAARRAAQGLGGDGDHDNLQQSVGQTPFGHWTVPTIWPPVASNASGGDVHSNSRRDTGPGHPRAATIRLEPMIEFLSDRGSAFEADCKVCQLIESGARTLLGPLDGASIQHVQSICDNMEVPYFELRPFVGSAGPTAAPPPFSADSSRKSAAGPSSSPSSFVRDMATAAAAGQRPPPGVQLHRHVIDRAAGQARAPASPLEDLTLNLYPPAHLLTSAYMDLIYAWNWSSFAIVYEDGSSMVKLQDLFRESSGTWTSKWRIKLFQFRPSPLADEHDHHHHQQQTTLKAPNDAPQTAQLVDSSQASGDERAANGVGANETREGSPAAPSADSDKHQAGQNFYSDPSPVEEAAAATNPTSRRRRQRSSSFRDLFWRIRDIGEYNILLDVRTEHLFEALKQAQQVGCMTERYSYLITSLDLHTIDLEDFKYSRTRMTAFNILEVAKSGSSRDGTSEVAPQQPFDERYLETLGVHVIQNHSPPEATNPRRPTSSSAGRSSDANNHDLSHTTNGAAARANKFKGFRLSPSVVLERQGSFMEPSGEAYREWSRREQLMSSPASMSLLPSVDRDNEQRLFEFLLEQQERNMSHVRLPTASAILHDSLILYALGLNELDPSGGFLGQQQALGCSLDSQPWLHGSSLVNYMRRISFTGLTGPISFDQRGLRTDLRLNLMGMAPDLGLVKVGEWHSRSSPSRAPSSDPGPSPSGSRGASAGATPPPRSSQSEDGAPSEGEGQEEGEEPETVNRRTYEEQSRFYESELRRYRKMLDEGIPVPVPYTKRLAPEGQSVGGLQVNEIIYGRLYREQEDQVDTLIVSTKLSQPYFMLKETPTKLSGNEQYEGFAVDLIHELSKLVNFKYRWREVADKKYGSKEILPNGTVRWNGMIGEIIRGQADLAIVDLTITAQRGEAVDFTLPFMNTGISILFKKPTTKVTTLFSFLSPFSSDVWAYVLAAYCGISAILFLVGHLSPYEWEEPHPCRHTSSKEGGEGGEEDADRAGQVALVLKNQFSLLNSFWFTIGSLMQQGSDLTPRSMSTRTIAGIWYFFTLIMISSYTANLAAFLTVEKVVYPIENVRDLSQQQEIKYGCVESGSTCTFFHDSQIDTYKRINETMRHYRTYVRSNDEGQKRVEEGKFAFFMESTSIEYIVERNCNLTQIGGLLDSKGYGLATSKRSRLKRPYRTLLSEGILHLQETGMLHILKNRWWKERRGGGTCTDDAKGGGVTELSLANVGGVFVVLLGGLGISFLVAIAEFMWRARRSGSTRDRMCEEMMSDLKFALACKSSTKPVGGARRRNNSGGGGGSKNTANNNSDSSSAPRRKLLAGGGGGGGSSGWLEQPASVWALVQSQLDQAPDSARQPIDASKQLANRQAPLGGKPCDPTLLQAMLTAMLMQQQEQQQSMNDDAPFASDAAKQVVADARRQHADPCRSLDARYHLPERQPNNCLAEGSGAGQGLHLFVSGRQPDTVAGLGALFSGAQGGGGGGGFASRSGPASAAETRGWQLATGSSSAAAADKRRLLLFAQQTIDTADDSTFMGQQQQRNDSTNSHF